MKRRVLLNTTAYVLIANGNEISFMHVHLGGTLLINITSMAIQSMYYALLLDLKQRKTLMYLKVLSHDKNFNY